jgi:hypothetical protein
MLLVPHLATFIFVYVIASIAYIHPLYDPVRTHDLLIVSRLPTTTTKVDVTYLFIYKTNPNQLK